MLANIGPHLEFLVAPRTSHMALTTSPIEDFLTTILPKLCPQAELKNSEIRKKIRIFCCEGHLAS